MKKNIFVFLGGYLPAKKYGGPVTSIVNLVKDLNDVYNFYIISNDHDLHDSRKLAGIKDGWNDVNGAKVLYLDEKKFREKIFFKILSQQEVSLVYLSSIFYLHMNYPAIKAARKLHIPILLAPRGEVCSNALTIKMYKKKTYLFIMKFIGFFQGLYFHSTSKDESEGIIKYLKISEENILELPNLHGKRENREINLKRKNSLNIVFLSRIQEKKNLHYAIEVISKLEGDITFDIYGPIEQPEYWKLCKEKIEKIDSGVKVRYCGTIDPGESKMIFSKYDCFFFPTLSENYGHVISEAILSGCPCIISKGTTPWDDIHGNGGFTIELSNTSGFVNVLSDIAAMDHQEYVRLVDKINQYTEKKLQTAGLIELYKEMFIKVGESLS